MIVVFVLQNITKSEKNRTKRISWFDDVLVTDAVDDSAISATYQIIYFQKPALTRAVNILIKVNTGS